MRIAARPSSRFGADHYRWPRGLPDTPVAPTDSCWRFGQGAVATTTQPVESVNPGQTRETATLESMRTLAIAAVLTLCTALGLWAESPFGELWRIKGVSIRDRGHGITLRWKASAYQHELPGHRAIKWRVGDDIRLESELVVSCRVPTSHSSAEPLQAELRLPRHPDAESQQGTVDRKETEKEMKEILDGGLAAVIAALATAGRTEERTPVRVGLGGQGAEFSSLLVQYPEGPSRASVVEPLEPDWVLSALVSEVEVGMTVEGEHVRADLRFVPNAGLARAGRMIVEQCTDH